MSESILLFFINISNPFLDLIANVSSFLGEQTILILILAIVMYTIDKNKGFSICGSLIISLFAMSSLKAIFRAPRPFTVISEIDGKRLATATGYSFPSGHTTGAASFYSALALAIKKRKISILCAISIILVGLSRMYLGVHWPIDVFAGLVLGITLSLIFYPLFEKAAVNENTKIKISIILFIITTIISFSLALLLDFEKIDPTAFTDFMKTMAFGAGGFYGIAYETKNIKYSVEGTMTQKILRVIILLIGMLVIQSGLKYIFPESIYYIGSFIRYFLVGLWLTALFPLLFKRLFN